MFGARGLSLGDLLNRVSEAILEGIPESIWIKAEISQLRTIKGDHLVIELVERDEFGNLNARAQSFLWKGKSITILSKFKTATGGKLNAGIKVMLFADEWFNSTKHPDASIGKIIRHFSGSQSDCAD